MNDLNGSFVLTFSFLHINNNSKVRSICTLLSRMTFYTNDIKRDLYIGFKSGMKECYIYKTLNNSNFLNV